MENIKKTIGSLIKNLCGKFNVRKTSDKYNIRRIVFSALMAAMSIVLAEFLSFKVPVMPSFMTFDFSDVPAMMASLTMGPVSGVFVCLVKNMFGLFTTKTGGIGELSNFILSVALVLPAGLITHKREKLSFTINGNGTDVSERLAHKSNKLSRAIIGCSVGAVVMALISIPSNYFLVFPAYSAVMAPMDVIIEAYQKLLPSVNSLMDCLIIFNMPFTFVKGACAAIVSIILYKKLRPIFNSMYREK